MTLYSRECECEFPEPTVSGNCGNCGKPIPSDDDVLDGFEGESYDRRDY